MGKHSAEIICVDVVSKVNDVNIPDSHIFRLLVMQGSKYAVCNEAQ